VKQDLDLILKSVVSIVEFVAWRRRLVVGFVG
jgi:hypothetical protein